MNRKLIAGLAGIALTAAAPAAFASNYSGESDERREPIYEDANGNGQYDEGETITGYRETNDVDCGEAGDNDAAVDGTGITVRGDSNESGEMAGQVCKDSNGPAAGTPADIEGRIIVAGDPTSGGYASIDGDKDNADQAQGWIRVDSDGTVRCADGSAEEGGFQNADSSTPGEEDGIEDCPVFEDVEG